MADEEIFISYRRGLDSHAAWRLFKTLEEHGKRDGRERVYLDVEDSKFGSDIADLSTIAINACRVFILLIGPGWLSGSDRLFGENDRVRFEIEMAIKTRKAIIPILLDGSVLPGKHELPSTIAIISDISGIEIRHENFKTVSESSLYPRIRLIASQGLTYTSIENLERFKRPARNAKKISKFIELGEFTYNSQFLAHLFNNGEEISLCATMDNQIYRLDVSGQVIDVSSHDYMQYARYSNDGSYCAVSLFDGPIKVLLSATCEEVARVADSAGRHATYVEFSPFGDFLAYVLMEKDLFLFNLLTAEIISVGPLKIDGRLADPLFRFSDDQKYLAYWKDSGELSVLDLRSRKESSFSGRRAFKVLTIDFSSGGDHLMVVYSNGSVNIIGLNGMKVELSRIITSRKLTAAAVVGDWTQLALVENEFSLRIIDLETLETNLTIEGKSSDFSGIEIERCSNRMVSIYRSYDSIFRVYQLE
jgi:WD40 repeat protein